MANTDVTTAGTGASVLVFDSRAEAATGAAAFEATMFTPMPGGASSGETDEAAVVGDAAHDTGGGTVVDGAVAGTSVRLPGLVGLLVIRADPARANLADALSAVLDIAVPARLASTGAGAYCLRWMSPDEWLLSCPPDETFDIETRLRAAVRGAFAISDVSGGYAVAILAGPGAREVLAKSTSLDVDPRVFGPGRVASTVFARTGATIRNIDDTRYEIVCRRSYADYVARWLANAAAEHGLKVTREAGAISPGAALTAT